MGECVCRQIFKSGTPLPCISQNDPIVPQKPPPPGVSRNLFLTVRALFSAASAALFRGFGTLRLSATIITYLLSENNPLSENCFRRKKIFVISLDKQISL